ATDVLHAINMLYRSLDFADIVGRLNFAANHHDSMLGVDIDLALGNVRIAEEHALDFVGQSSVVQPVAVVAAMHDGLTLANQVHADLSAVAATLVQAAAGCATDTHHGHFAPALAM